MSRESRPRLQSGPKSGRFRCRSRERCSRWWPKRLPQQAWSKGLQRRLHGRVRPGRVADMEPPASGVCSGNGCPHDVAGLIALLHHVPQLVFHNASRASVVVPGVPRSLRPVPWNPHPLGFFSNGGAWTDSDAQRSGGFKVCWSLPFYSQLRAKLGILFSYLIHSTILSKI